MWDKRFNISCFLFTKVHLIQGSRVTHSRGLLNGVWDMNVREGRRTKDYENYKIESD